MSKKSIAIAIIAIIILIVGAGVWKWQENKKVEEVKKQEIAKQNEVKKEEEKQKTEVDMNDWKIYRNEEFGFEVKYPREWNFRNDNKLGNDKYFFEKREYEVYFGIFPNGGFGHGIPEPKITYEKFRGRDAKIFWFNKSYPGYIHIEKNWPKNWNDENGIEIVGLEEDTEVLQKIYNSFKFID
jgi:hypothetical protein